VDDLPSVLSRVRQTRTAKEDQFVLNKTKLRCRLAKVALSVDHVSLIVYVAYQALVDQVFSEVDQSQRNHILEQWLDESNDGRETVLKHARVNAL
jgi:hypothetical protein